jgi:hypothetical protein
MSRLSSYFKDCSECKLASLAPSFNVLRLFKLYLHFRESMDLFGDFESFVFFFFFHHLVIHFTQLSVVLASFAGLDRSFVVRAVAVYDCLMDPRISGWRFLVQ